MDAVYAAPALGSRLPLTVSSSSSPCFESSADLSALRPTEASQWQGQRNAAPQPAPAACAQISSIYYCPPSARRSSSTISHNDEASHTLQRRLPVVLHHDLNLKNNPLSVFSVRSHCAPNWFSVSIQHSSRQMLSANCALQNFATAINSQTHLDPSTDSLQSCLPVDIVSLALS